MSRSQRIVVTVLTVLGVAAGAGYAVAAVPTSSDETEPAGSVNAAATDDAVDPALLERQRDLRSLLKGLDSQSDQLGKRLDAAKARMADAAASTPSPASAPSSDDDFDSSDDSSGGDDSSNSGSGSQNPGHDDDDDDSSYDDHGDDDDDEYEDEHEDEDEDEDEDDD